jgi:3-deoxy-D-manno-octulosonic-acid transferase
MRALYGWALLPLALALALPIALFHPKLRDSLLARRGVWRRLREAEPRRDPARPLIWFHVASAGELLQAEPLIRRCRQAGAQVAVTLTSVSGLGWTDRFAAMPEVIWSDAMPFDFPWAVRRVWRALQPSAIVYVQADLWPGLVWEAAALGTPQLLIAARVSARSFRWRHGLGRVLYGVLYRRLRAIHALGEADRARLKRIVPDHPALEAAGDPGIETALARVREARPAALPPAFDRRAGPVLIAGSVWPPDERHLLPVLTEGLRALPTLKAILAPHEPSAAHLAALESQLASWRPLRLSALASLHGEAPRIVLVDSVGQLASLYGAASVAYVGGGFGAGVHNVAEPAAAGLPVLFGPRHGNSAVALALLEQGCAFTCEDAGALGLALLPLLRDPVRAAELGAKAKATVEGMAGTAERAFAAIQEAVPGL